jgi:hypothetical protein
VIIEDDFENGSKEHFFIREKDGSYSQFQLDDVTEIKNLKSGSIIKVTGSYLNENDILQVQSFEIMQSIYPKSTEALSNQKLKVAVILHDFSACGSSGVTSVNEAQMRNILFESTNPRDYTMTKQLTSCSHGKLSIDSENSIVVTARATASSCSTQRFTWNQCPSSANFNAFHQTMTQISGINSANYQYIWHVMVGSMKCSFAGLGTVGGKPGVIWIPTQFASTIFVWIHEFGHNLGLSHAGIINSQGAIVEYGDGTSAMGNINDVCFNLANEAQVGLASPQSVQNSQLPLGTWVKFSVTASDNSIETGLKIVTSTRTAQNPSLNTNLFLSYRRSAFYKDFVTGEIIPVGGDTKFDSKLSGILFHLWPNVRSAGTPFATTFEGSLPISIGQTKSETEFSGIHVRVEEISSDKSTATISVCRCALGSRISCCTSTAPPNTNPTSTPPPETLPPTFRRTKPPTTLRPTLSPPSSSPPETNPPTTDAPTRKTLSPTTKSPSPSKTPVPTTRPPTRRTTKSPTTSKPTFAPTLNQSQDSNSTLPNAESGPGTSEIQAFIQSPSGVWTFTGIGCFLILVIVALAIYFSLKRKQREINQRLNGGAIDKTLIPV